MTDREKLIEILSVPIYPRAGADLAEVVADYLLDNDVKPLAHAHWKESAWGAYCSECGCELEHIINLRARSILKDFDVPDDECYNYVDIAKPYPCYCPNCGARMDEEVSDAE